MIEYRFVTHTYGNNIIIAFPPGFFPLYGTVLISDLHMLRVNMQLVIVVSPNKLNHIHSVPLFEHSGV